MSSPFLEIPPSEWVAENALAFAIRDRFPVSPDHTLVVTRRLVPTWFEATAEEQTALFELVDVVKRELDRGPNPPDGYNVGFNTGEAAGQTVLHLHVHVIPRYRGDVPDPTGGVRHVIPERGNYRRPAPLATGTPRDPFLRHILPLLARADSVSIVAAFIQQSGLRRLQYPLFARLADGARVRILTGDYLNITQTEALQTLLDWRSLAPWAEEGSLTGSLETRVVEVDRLQGRTRSFHPKAWMFEGPELAAAFVGSSNLSQGALGDGVEWNLRADRVLDPQAYGRIGEAFDDLWSRATLLTREWVEAYALRARQTAAPPPVEEVEDAGPSIPPEPNAVQREALAALAASRAAGHRRALAVMATGLGKTWLSAFDVEAVGQQVEAKQGRPPRVLFLAHRGELLVQAAGTFRTLFRRSFPAARVTWFAAENADFTGDLVLASVQKLSRPENLPRLEGQRFDYVIVDEVHHASAPSYRRVLDRIDPGFLLGLTATPDRADEADILGVFDDHLAYRADLGLGIERGLLAPFAYHGLRDDVDYANIPWRNRRFDPERLAEAVQTQARMRRLWQAWNELAASRTLVFCCSIEHAEFTRNWLTEQGVRVVAVHSGEGSDDREGSLRRLQDGELDAICSVDLFNEGVDVPAVDRVVMLRPTESPVLFLQQLGRGLRVAAGKERLLVIDFVGNHRVFLDRLRLLLSLAPRPTLLRDFLGADSEPDLPPGCSLDVELEAKELLMRILQPAGRGAVEEAYRELHAAREPDERPTAGELFRLGYLPSTLRAVYGSWFGFVARQGHLDEQERLVFAAAEEWLDAVETCDMTKCFKMVVLEALLDAEALESGLPIQELARRSHAILVRDPDLFRDIEDVSALPRPREFDSRFVAYWRKNPIHYWARHKWFREEGERFVSRVSAPEGLESVLAKMTRELMEYKLAQYRKRAGLREERSSFECKVTWNQRDPILKLPARERQGNLPTEEVEVQLPEGTTWLFRFRKEFINVARPVTEKQNRLPDLLRTWFGPAAGHPGTSYYVRFEPSASGWTIEPVGVPQASPSRGLLPCYASLRAAAGEPSGTRTAPPETDEVRLPVRPVGEPLFAVRAAGDSMDGGKTPIRNGDWLVMRFERGASVAAVEGRVALLQVEDDKGAHAYQVKRVLREGPGWLLRSDNPAHPALPASERTVPIALLAEIVRPEDLGPAPGASIPDAELASAFGLEERPRTGRVDGHLFLMVEASGVFLDQERVSWRVRDRRPGETAFVLSRFPGETAWRYHGVARWSDEEGLWRLPAQVQ